METTNSKQTKKRGGWKLSEETKRRISNAVRGRKLSEETKKKISLANKLAFKENRKNVLGRNNPFFGKTWSSEHREKIMITWTPERRKKTSKLKSGIKYPSNKGNRKGNSLINTPHPKCNFCDKFIRFDNTIQACREHQTKSLIWKEKQKNYRELNHKKIKQQINEYTKNHRKEKRLYDKKRWLLTKEKRRSYFSKYINKRRKEDILYRLKHILRHRIWAALNTHFIKNKKTIELLGAEISIVKSYLEKQFKLGMTWENYGKNGWHIDHIIPLVSAKSREEMEKLCHYTNLQPLWAIDNLRKGKTIVEHLERIRSRP